MVPLSSSPVQLVWFKRDLRIRDHAPLVRAAEAGPVLPIFIAEPSIWQAADASGRQWAFVEECLEELDRDLRTLGSRLTIRCGDAIDVFETLAATVAIGAIWSHEETGNLATYARDRQVAAWCRARSVPWHQLRQNGVIRGLRQRNGWARRWETTMAASPIPAPTVLSAVEGDELAPPTDEVLGVGPDPCPGRQIGGTTAALAALDSFLTQRGQTYQRAMSSPVTAADACSRLSPHLAWGTISTRQVVHRLRARKAELAGVQNPGAAQWRRALTSFDARLHWRCHFMQKLESQPSIETTELHHAYRGFWQESHRPDRLEAWATGQTGVPLVDACMRSVAATGWLTFRMRAMVMSFASHHLGIDWRQSGAVLARYFTDYEPGIHWPQVQMQSGSTGINTIRIYNPTKQTIDQDPDGVFIRHWVPALREAPLGALATPWKVGGIAGYPNPIVDVDGAARAARERLHGVRKGSAYRTTASAIQHKHGSRSSGIRHRGQRAQKKRPDAAAQLSLFGDD